MPWTEIPHAHHDHYWLRRYHLRVENGVIPREVHQFLQERYWYATYKVMMALDNSGGSSSDPNTAVTADRFT